MSAGDPALLVTGGSRGIGAAVCLAAAGQGWRVAVNYASNRGAADTVVESIAAAGGEAIAAEGDVGTEDGIAAIFAAVDAVLHLLSPSASYVTGAILNVSGGR